MQDKNRIFKSEKVKLQSVRFVSNSRFSISFHLLYINLFAELIESTRLCATILKC